LVFSDLICLDIVCARVAKYELAVEKLEIEESRNKVERVSSVLYRFVDKKEGERGERK
jgi:hypothetical protein